MLILTSIDILVMEMDLMEEDFFFFFFLHPDGETGKNVIIFGADMSSSVHVDNKKKDILILGKDPTQVFCVSIH